MSQTAIFIGIALAAVSLRHYYTGQSAVTATATAAQAAALSTHQSQQRPNTMLAATAASGYTRFVLGRGCDPARAAFAAREWSPLLGVQIDSATSDAELRTKLRSGRKYDVFFIAPGQCQLIKMGRVDGEAMKALVRQHQPAAKVCWPLHSPFQLEHAGERPNLSE